MARTNTTDAVEILRRRYVEGKPEMIVLLDEERSNAEIAREIYELRTRAGLTQAKLASRIGTSTSVICRLEDADYGGHSLSMLRRVALALGTRVELRFAPIAERHDPSRVRMAAKPAAAQKQPKRGSAGKGPRKAP